MKLSPQYLLKSPFILIAGGVAAVPLLWWLFAHFGADIVLVIAPLAAAAAAAYRVHLKRLAQKTEEVSEASRIHLATVEALASAIDARDGEGIGHVRRAQIYAVGLGRILERSEAEVEALRTGALLHGIGKLAIPDHILNKPGTLTQAEMEKAKINSDVAASILENIGFDYPVVPTVKYHHERWDGKGYPEGLMGDSIPMTARILAVADVFDTLRAARPYRPAKSREAARQIIQSEAGTRFDPAVVDALLRNLNNLEDEINTAGLGYTTLTPASMTTNYVEQIKLANREVFSLYNLAREFSSAAGLKETLELCTKKVAELVPFDTCALYLLDDEKAVAEAVHVQGDNADILSNQKIKSGQGATGYALAAREIVQNVDPDLDFFHVLPELTQIYSALASVPLVANDQVIGALTLYSREFESYGEEHIRLLETISRIAADAIDKSAEHDEARTHALTDPMTGLPNARCLQIQFEKEVARAGRSGSSFQLLMLDLDGFKAVNDTFGHKAGDALLKEIAGVIRAELREYDFLARYGGDEFVAIIPETSSEDVADLGQRIEAAVRAYRLVMSDDRFASVGVSLGSAAYPEHGSSFDQMIIAADKGMYERKMERKRRIATTTVSPQIIEIGTASIEPIVDAEEVDETFIVELDETHVLNSIAIN